MPFFLKSKWPCFSLQTIRSHKYKLHSTLPSTELHDLCNVISKGIGSLDDLEDTLNKFAVFLSSSFLTRVIDFCNNEAPTRRLLRFFLWSRKNPNFKLKDEDFNHVIRVFAEKKDFVAIDIVLTEFRKEGRVMETQTYSLLAETLVKLGREDEALGLFKNLDKFNCAQDEVTVSAIVNSLCSKGHARRAEGVVWHHRSKILGVEPCVYKSLLHGWCQQGNMKEARRILKEMKSLGIKLDLFCYNTFLRGLCKRNLKSNPSALVPDASNLMMEMRSHGISPTSISYNILLNSLVKTRRVKESNKILISMKKSGCSPDWVSYYLVSRVLYLTGRFGKGNQIVDEMIESGLIPSCKFYYDLIGILCGVERLSYALKLFEKMKESSLGGYGPIYDLLIMKLCKGGEFEKARDMWDEAAQMGVILQCSRDVLDPSIIEVFEPRRKENKGSMRTEKRQEEEPKTIGGRKRHIKRNKKKKKHQIN